MKINSALSMQRVMLIVLFGLLPWITTSQTTTAQQTTLFSDRSTFLSGARAPSCSGPEDNGCNCENSQYRCRDPGRADMCSNNEAGCVTTVEGDPICASGAGKECSSSSDCAAG